MKTTTIRSLEKVTFLFKPGVSLGLQKRISDTASGSRHSSSPLRKDIHAVSAFFRRSAFFRSFQLTSYSSLIRRAIGNEPRRVPGAHCSVDLTVPIVLLAMNG